MSASQSGKKTLREKKGRKGNGEKKRAGKKLLEEKEREKEGSQLRIWSDTTPTREPTSTL